MAKPMREMTNKEFDAYQASCIWGVLAYPGEAGEWVESIKHPTHKDALTEVEKARKAGVPADVVKMLPDGTFTTEF